MSFKLALLLLFGFVALAVAVPLEDTEEKAEPAQPTEADTEIPEDPQEEFESDESEDENQEDSEEEPETDDKEEEPENEEDALEEDDNDKRGRKRRLVKVCGRPIVRRHRCPQLGYLCVLKGNKRFHHRICYVCKKGKKRRRRRRYLIVRVCQSCGICRGRFYYYRPRLICRRLCSKGKCRYPCRCSCRRPRPCRKG